MRIRERIFYSRRISNGEAWYSRTRQVRTKIEGEILEEDIFELEAHGDGDMPWEDED